MSLATAPRPEAVREPALVDAPAPPRTNYRPDIDGIRGTAAIMVMGYHGQVPGFEGAFIGLDLFFVVSGFVITGLLLGEFNRTGGIRWSAFYARRARRLIPAKATMLVGVLVLSYFVMAPTGAQQDTARSAAAAASFVSNFFFWQVAEVDYFAAEPGTGVLLHTWSLSVEEQFYLALPLCVLLAWLVAKALRLRLPAAFVVTAVVLSVASLWGAVALSTSDPDGAYYLPVTRAFEFLLGVILALVVTKVHLPSVARHLLGLVGGALVVYCLVDPMPTDRYPYFWALIPCAAAFLMIWAGTGSNTLITRFLSFRLFVWLGLISYGWYLWHWPLLVMGESMNLAVPPLWVRITLVMVALLLAILSYHLIEGVFYKRSGHRSAARTYGGPRVVVTGVTTMTIVITMAGGAFLLAKNEAETPHWQAVAEQLTDTPRMPEECVQGDELIPSKPVACEIVPYEEDRPTVVLWGDSHAWMYIPALQKAIDDRDVNLMAFVMGGCPPFYQQAQVSSQCSLSNRMALDFIKELRSTKQPYRLILSASWELYLDGGVELLTSQQEQNRGADPDYIAKMAALFQDRAPRLFERLGEIGVPTDVIAPTASVKRPAPLCEAVARPYSCDLAREEAIKNEAATRAWLAEHMQLLPDEPRLIDVTPEMCTAETCYAERDGTMTFFDDNHLSATLSRGLDTYFEESVQAVLQ